MVARAAPGWLPWPAGAAVPEEKTAQQRTEQTLALTVVLFRLGGLASLALVLAMDAATGGWRGQGLAVLLAAAIIIDCAILIAGWLRHCRVPPTLAVADLAVTAMALASGAVVGGICGPGYFAYPYSIASSVAYGISFRRLGQAAAATCFLGAAEGLPAIMLRLVPAPHAIFDASMYVPNVMVAFAVAGVMRRTAVDLDAGRLRVAEQAEERARLRQARLLHDSVLQTVEFLAAGDCISDEQVRGHVAAEALRLRGFIATGTLTEGGSDLASMLRQLASDMARLGLRVELLHHGLGAAASRLTGDPHLCTALVAVAREGLTNVLTHAGVDRAVLRLTANSREVNLTVLDHGRGFDPATPLTGFGINQSLRGRVAELGGVVRIQSRPGAGTRVEVTLPRL